MTDITHFSYLLTLLVSLIITCCCHLVVPCRNTIESSRTWNFIDLSFSPPLSNSSKPSKQSKSASPPSKPLTLAYDGDVDMWSSSRWLYIQSTSWTACNIFKCSSFQGTLWISKKKKKKGRETRSNRHKMCSIHKTFYVRLQGQRFQISGRRENCDI